MRRVLLAFLVTVLLSPVLLHAQKSEIAVTVGGFLSPDAKGLLTCGEAILCPIPPGTIGPVSFGLGLAGQATFAQRVVNFKSAALYVEAPVAWSLSRTTPDSFIGSQFASIFVTPSAKVQFLPRARISPFASAGGGLAHFSTMGSGSTTGAWQVGGGVDFRTPLRLMSVRTELRDFISGRPGSLGFGGVTSNHIQNLFAGGGVVFKF